MESPNVQQLIDSGAHFGCRVSRWNPKMAPYIQGRRNLIHIIDLRETLRGLLRAQNFLFRIAAEGQQVLWVGTKRQVKGVIAEAGQRSSMPVVTERWIGGTLTNFSVIRSRAKRLEELETAEESGGLEAMTKKELAGWRREKRKITRNLGGIRELTGIPGAVVIVDPLREGNAAREARKMGVPAVGVLDTDCDPDSVDLVIPANDDSLKSVRLLVDCLARAVEEGVANWRERIASMGDAERTDEAMPSDEPRPTRTASRPTRSVRALPVFEEDDTGGEEVVAEVATVPQPRGGRAAPTTAPAGTPPAGPATASPAGDG